MVATLTEYGTANNSENVMLNKTITNSMLLCHYRDVSHDGGDD
jgi:hypothetical protein